MLSFLDSSQSFFKNIWNFLQNCCVCGYLDVVFAIEEEWISLITLFWGFFSSFNAYLARDYLFLKRDLAGNRFVTHGDTGQTVLPQFIILAKKFCNWYQYQYQFLQQIELNLEKDQWAPYTLYYMYSKETSLWWVPFKLVFYTSEPCWGIAMIKLKTSVDAVLNSIFLY